MECKVGWYVSRWGRYSYVLSSIFTSPLVLTHVVGWADCRSYHHDWGDDDAEGQRRSDGYTFFKTYCISLREAIAELCWSCTSCSLTFCISECLHELCVSYINILNDDCIMRDEVELYGVVWYYFIGNNQHYVILGLRLALKWASRDVNLTIYTPTELGWLTKDCI